MNGVEIDLEMNHNFDELVVENSICWKSSFRFDVKLLFYVNLRGVISDIQKVSISI
jgi:hypothetical protein